MLAGLRDVRNVVGLLGRQRAEPLPSIFDMITALSSVRNSWLILVTNSVLVLLADSAASFSCTSTPSAATPSRRQVEPAVAAQCLLA